MNIVVSGASRHMNLGGPSIFHGLVRVLRHVFPGCGIVYHEAVAGPCGESGPDPDCPDIRILRGQPNAKKILLAAARRKWLGRAGSPSALEERLIDAIRKADLFVDAWGIDFTDRLSKMNLRGALLAKPLIRVAAMFGTPAVHYTASYGPMAGRGMRMAARRVLGRQCTMVFCRERKSRDILIGCGVEARKLVVAPDTGFLMPSRAVEVEGLQPGIPCLGISVSHQIIRQWTSPEPYLDMVAALCDRAVRQWGVQVMLIPNELAEGRYDDRAVARDVLERVQSKKMVHVFPAERHTGPEQKGAIARCDLFVASRYHSIVAAMSLGVPTVVIGWHHKYAELLEKFGQEEVGLSSDDCTLEALWTRCEIIGARRQEVRAEIQSRLPDVERRIFEVGESLRELRA
jgi:polysaccharide pyruvyl transferase WcaK-like protein